MSMLFDPLHQAPHGIGDLSRATAADLDGSWVEFSDFDVDEVDPPALDPDPTSSMEWSRLNKNVVFESPCWQQTSASWVWQGPTESRLIAVVGEGDGGHCPGQVEMATLTQMFTSVPEVQTDGTRLALHGRIDSALLASTPPEPECSAGSMGSPQLQVGDVGEPVAATAQQLPDAALACDSETLIEMATKDQTLLSLGITAPASTFGLPETSAQPYATLVDVLTSGPPALITNPEDQFTGATWPAEAVTGESFWGYRVSISPDGAWTGFLALD